MPRMNLHESFMIIAVVGIMVLISLGILGSAQKGAFTISDPVYVTAP